MGWFDSRLYTAIVLILFDNKLSISSKLLVTNCYILYLQSGLKAKLYNTAKFHAFNVIE